jgi:hypothetical protein
VYDQIKSKVVRWIRSEERRDAAHVPNLCTGEYLVVSVSQTRRDCTISRENFAFNSTITLAYPLTTSTLPSSPFCCQGQKIAIQFVKVVNFISSGTIRATITFNPPPHPSPPTPNTLPLEPGPYHTNTHPLKRDTPLLAITDMIRAAPILRPLDNLLRNRAVFPARHPAPTSHLSRPAGFLARAAHR